MRNVEVWVEAIQRADRMGPVAAEGDIHAAVEVARLTAKKSGAHSA
jgi:hypothetical protein